MPDAELCILSTRALAQSLIDKAAAHGITIEIIPFIQTTPLPKETIENNILPLLKRPVTAVFTSVQAVISVSRFLTDSKPLWNIYCLNEATQEAVTRYFDAAQIAGVAADSASLAALIVTDKPQQEIIFFCGNKRKDTIPQVLARHHMPVKEEIVYTTEARPVSIDKTYNGIAFFSPSAVESFFSINTIQNGTACFAIGDTTAAAIRPFLTNTEKLFISAAHNAAALVQLITETLHAQPEK
ncbi:uroporphyrinogen-III synthase [Chitinophagaceae bacterium MMS25-I14]